MGRARGSRGGAGPLLALVLAAGCGIAALGAVGALLRPNWPGAVAAAEAPTLPISVAGVVFNVPQQAIRFPLQRRPGAQPRLDLAFPGPPFVPALAAGPAAATDGGPPRPLFVSIAGPHGSLPLEARLRTIYPRYLAAEGFAGPQGLNGIAFRDDTPYRGEDLLFAEAQPERFLARCSRATATTPGTCLMERSVGAAEITVRFPREWLSGWPQVADGLERLLASLHSVN